MDARPRAPGGCPAASDHHLGSLVHLPRHAACTTATRRCDKHVASRGRRGVEPRRGGLTAMGQYLPIVAAAGAGHPVRPAQPRRVEAARRQRARRGQGGALRVRHRARAGSRRERFPVSFYLVAMMFIMFDIEIIFFFPYAVVYRDARALRVLRDRASSASSFFAVLRVPGRQRRRSTGARSSAAGASTSCRRPHDDRRRSAGSASRAASPSRRAAERRPDGASR